jgi:DNA-binding GntR family transcriptional regulator
VPEGSTLPSKQSLARAIDCSSAPIKKVLDALVADGTLNTAVKDGRTHYVRVRTPRAVSSWLPLHLRHSMKGDS